MRQSLALARKVAALIVALALTAASSGAQDYHVAATHVIGGDGGWDYVALDTVGHRLFIARNDRVLVVDEASGKPAGEIPGFKRAHGVAFDCAARRGFGTSGEDSSVVVFNLDNLAVIKRVHADDDADAILFDPATKHVFTMNGDAGTSSVIDPATGTRIANIPLGGKPEFGVTRCRRRWDRSPPRRRRTIHGGGRQCWQGRFRLSCWSGSGGYCVPSSSTSM